LLSHLYSTCLQQCLYHYLPAIQTIGQVWDEVIGVPEVHDEQERLEQEGLEQEQEGGPSHQDGSSHGPSLPGRLVSLRNRCHCYSCKGNPA
jgi:hypothetical protein